MNESSRQRPCTWPDGGRAEEIDLDETRRLLCRFDDAQQAEDAEAAVRQIHHYLTIDRLWALLAETQAGRDLADDLRQYEDHLIGVEAALDTYRKRCQGRAL